MAIKPIRVEILTQAPPTREQTLSSEIVIMTARVMVAKFLLEEIPPLLTLKSLKRWKTGFLPIGTLTTRSKTLLIHKASVTVPLQTMAPSPEGEPGLM